MAKNYQFFAIGTGYLHHIQSIVLTKHTAVRMPVTIQQ